MLVIDLLNIHGKVSAKARGTRSNVICLRLMKIDSHVTMIKPWLIQIITYHSLLKIIILNEYTCAIFKHNSNEDIGNKG